MKAWRIYDHHAVYAQAHDFDPLSGAGGLHQPARWHHKGGPILYAASGSSLAMLVPSIVAPYEQNVIINRAHPRASSLRIVHSDVIALDHRLIRSLGAQAVDRKK